MDAEKRVAIAEVCPSGAIRRRRNDGRPNESPPPVNLTAIPEGGPYAVLAGRRQGFGMTLCRCGASKDKPFSDCSHHDVKCVRCLRRTADRTGRHAGCARWAVKHRSPDGWALAGARQSRNHCWNRPCPGAGPGRHPLLLRALGPQTVLRWNTRKGVLQKLSCRIRLRPKDANRLAATPHFRPD